MPVSLPINRLQILLDQLQYLTQKPVLKHVWDTRTCIM